MKTIPRWLVCLSAMVLLTVSAAGADQFDRALQQALAHIQASKKLSDPEKAKARLDAMKTVMSTADAVGKGLEDFHAYVEAVRHTGLCFDHDFEGLDQVTRHVGKVTDAEWFKSFRKATEVGGKLYKYGGYAAAARVGLAKARKALTEQRDLPAGARKSLAALIAVGTVLEQCGDVPGLGKCLAAYGQVTEKMIGLVEKTRDRIVYDVNEGALMGKDLPELKGLPENLSTVGYQRTDLWRKGVPVIKGVQDHTAHEYFLRGDSGVWVRLSEADYERAKAVSAYWMITHEGEAPKPNRVLKLLNDPEARRDLRSEADDEVRWVLHKKRVRRVMIDPDKPLIEANREFHAAEKEIQAWAADLGVPMDRQAADAALRLYFYDRAWAERWFRNKLYMLYPDIRAAMVAKGYDPDSAGIDALRQAAGQYRRYVQAVADGRRKPIDFSRPADPPAAPPAAPPTAGPAAPPLPPGHSPQDDALTKVAPPPKATGSLATDRRAVTAWRDRQIADLRRRMAADPLRAANKRAALAGAGKPKEMACGRCDYNGKHWWIENSWSCPRCEYVTTVQDRKRADGLTYRQYAAARIRLYEDKIAAVRRQADALLKPPR